jgi:hypothetical protein
MLQASDLTTGAVFLGRSMHFKTLFTVQELPYVLMKSARDRAYLAVFPFLFSVQDFGDRIHFALESCGCMVTNSLLVHGKILILLWSVFMCCECVICKWAGITD